MGGSLPIVTMGDRRAILWSAERIAGAAGYSFRRSER
jgi:hypothetical protein